MASTSAAHWRRWALLSILAWPGCGALTTSALKNQFDRKGWGHLLPANGRWDSLHRALLAEEKAGKVKRLSGRPSRWQITPLGQDFAHDFIIGNPNITPEESRV